MKLLLAILSVSFLFVGAFIPLQQPVAASEAMLAETADGPLFPPMEDIREYYRRMPPVQRAWTLAVGLFAAVGWGALLLYGLLRLCLWLFAGPIPVLITLRKVWLAATGAVLVVGSVIRAIVSQVYTDGDWLNSCIVVLIGCITLCAGMRLQKARAGAAADTAPVQK